MLNKKSTLAHARHWITQSLSRKRSQITIFIIVGIILVGAIVGFFVYRDSISFGNIPSSIEPAYFEFLSCLEDYSSVGIDLIGFQAGYIDLPKFESGSAYMPFSSQLNFLGNPIPYWYYVSGNNIQREQVPSVNDMDKQLAKFVEGKIVSCNLKKYYYEGFEIEFSGEPKAKVDITDDKVDVSLNMNINFKKGEDSVSVNNHKVSIKSNLGKLYKSAKKIYEHEQKTLFLENYAVDNIRLYTPVDGVELTCSPLIWNTEEVFDRLENAIEGNTLALKTKGGDYSLSQKENKYFIVDVSVDENVQFLNSKKWTKSFEVEPSEGGILISKPVGNQPGLGALGFCYVPYHYVYNVKYPVLIQISEGDELFQFPVAVVVQGNKPRNPLNTSASEIQLPELCNYKNTLVKVNVYDTSLNPIEADISFECLSTKCDIGKATISDGLYEKFPQCVNGYIRATAKGYKDARYLISTTKNGNADIIMDKLYDVDVELKLDGRNYNRDAIITFISDDLSATIVYPNQKSVKLAEGQYEVLVNVYRNSSLKLVGENKKYCVEAPQGGIGGILGLTKEKCFDIQIPDQIISNALAGGGKENYYILESELQNSKTIEIHASSLPAPTTLEQLQDNYVLFEDKGLDIYFK